MNFGCSRPPSCASALSRSGARNLTDGKALRFVAVSFVVFHGASALLEGWAWTTGVSGRIWANVVVRVVAVALFAYYGIARRS